MSSSDTPRRHFTEVARMAALAARRAKRAEPDTFGLPELFIVKAGDHSFTWELRRSGGVVLQRGAEAFPSQALARANGEIALAALRADAGPADVPAPDEAVAAPSPPAGPPPLRPPAGRPCPTAPRVVRWSDRTTNPSEGRAMTTERELPAVYAYASGQHPTSELSS